MANLTLRTVVHYDGTDYGRIYLGDVGQRHQLGGGKGLYTQGQDRYIKHGQDATFATSGDVLTSYATAHGRIGKFVTKGAFHVTNDAGVAL